MTKSGSRKLVDGFLPINAVHGNLVQKAGPPGREVGISDMRYLEHGKE
jgi:hypothetical protein